MTSDLIARIEAADASQQRELLEAAAVAIWGPEAGEVVINDPDLYDRMCRFDTLLEAEAYESAALMLVPDDHPKWAVTGRNSATCGNKNGVPGLMEWVFAATPALALAAAALRAQEKQDG